MPKIRGLAAGIGSMPHTEPDAALDLIFKYTPQIPFWPQLPKRDVREGMVAQFTQGLPCLRVSADGVFFDGSDKERELEKFYDRLIREDLGYFGIGADFALGLHEFHRRLKGADLSGIEFIKAQVSGPFTFAASISDETGRLLLYDSVFMQVILKGLAMKALWQIDYFKEFNKPMVLFFDEPYLSAFGSGYTPLNREDVVKILSEFCAGIKSKQVLLGVHCCGNTDWSIFTEIKDIDIINFDAFSFLDTFVLYAKDLKAFLERGGIICWGIVPTLVLQENELAAVLVRKVKEGINALVKKGVPESLLLERLIVSPACGLG
ncbi:MAG: methionine synthase, partial [Candidatus Omnitrophota bacterium]